MKSSVFVMILFFMILSCSQKSNQSNDEIELKVKEPLKGILDSLIALDASKNLIQELSVNLYGVGQYRVGVIARPYSMDREYGKPLCYFMSNGKKIYIYTGLEYFFQPMKEKKYKDKKNGSDTIKYRIIDFGILGDSKVLHDLEFRNPSNYIPLVVFPIDSIE